VVPVGRLHPRRQAGHLLLRPPVRGRRAHRLVGLQPVRVQQPGALRGQAGHQLLHAAADPVRGRLLRRLHRPGRRPPRLPRLVRHPQPGPGPLPGQRHPRQPAPPVRHPAPNAPYNNDQEIYTAAVRVPSG
jgi:hypothetical protein